MNKPQISLTSLVEVAVARANQDETDRVYAELGVVDATAVEQIQQLREEQGLSVVQAARALECVDEDVLREALAAKFGMQQIVGEPDNELSDELVAVYEPHHPFVENLRLVREELTTRWFGAQHQVLAISGAEPGAGTSRVAANLAVLFAQRGNRVLLIDADFRKQHQKDLFSIKSSDGLTDCLAGWVDFNDAATRITRIPGLSVMTVGTPPPPQCEILSRREFSELVKKAGEEFDVVLIDVPATPFNADIVSVAMCAGGSFLVMRKNVTRLATARALAARINAVGAKVVGVVLNEF